MPKQAKRRVTANRYIPVRINDDLTMFVRVDAFTDAPGLVCAAIDKARAILEVS